MYLLNEFFNSIEVGTTEVSNAKEILKDKGYICNTFKTHCTRVARDEYEDLEQDIILLVLEADRNYDKKLSNFSTYLTWQLKSVSNNFINKYTGVNYSSRQRTKDRKNGKLVYITTTNLEEEV
ncbi:MAG: hypothetical protein ACRCX7_07145 [Cetobacterium sp.]|uniref:hypothetical protein n=1 Tax=Cetobacterium sp. TaxID=2071632 RepID=UPI003F31351A